MERPRFVLIYTVAVFCLLFEVTLSHRLQLAGCRPELLFVVALFWGLETTPDRAMTHAWMTGMLKDMFSSHPFGLYAFLFALIALLVSLIRHMVFRESMLTLFLLGFTWEMVVNVFAFLILYVTGGNIAFWSSLWFAVKISLYSAGLGVLVLRPMVLFEYQLGFRKY